MNELTFHVDTTMLGLTMDTGRSSHSVMMRSSARACKHWEYIAYVSGRCMYTNLCISVCVWSVSNDQLSEILVINYFSV